MHKVRLPRWAVVIAAAFLYIGLAADWCAPDVGLHIAYGVLGGGENSPGLFPLWERLVGWAGKDLVLLGCISLASALFDIALVATIFGDLFDYAIRRAEMRGRIAEYRFAEFLAVLLVSAAFAFTPGFLAAATRVSPLMTSLLPPLTALAVLIHFLTDGGAWLERLRRYGPAAVLVVALSGYFVYELASARRIFLVVARGPLAVFLVLGVLPALVFAWSFRQRWLTSLKSRIVSFGLWAVAVLVLLTMTLNSGMLESGRSVSRVVGQIVVRAEGYRAVLSEGTLDEALFFMLPDGIRLVSPGKGRDLNARYCRELASWARSVTKDPDLEFAAEYGPMALIDEWARKDSRGLESNVLIPTHYFPTRQTWESACAELAGMRAGDIFQERIRVFLGACGNALGCQLIESGRLKDAWEVFRRIVQSVAPENYVALVNLTGMMDRGYEVPKSVRDEILQMRQDCEKRLTGYKDFDRAIRLGGRIYVAPEERARRLRLRKELLSRHGLPPKAQEFLKLVKDAQADPGLRAQAREAIRSVTAAGLVRPDVLSGCLLAFDLSLGDRQSAESDATQILRFNRHDAVANEIVGSLNCARGDYAAAERYLRRALATGKASVNAKNDLACALFRTDRLAEAETLAREAVAAKPKDWNFRETLTAILIRDGRLEEGARELAETERLAREAGVPEGTVVGIEIDRARILHSKGDVNKLRIVLRKLRSRRDLTAEQQNEIKGLDW